jgi:Flp pilus assembly protein TadB
MTTRDPLPGEVIVERSLTDLLFSAKEDALSLVKGEVELAKAEARVSAQRAGKGAGLFAGAGLLALTAWFLGHVAVAWGIVAAGLPAWAGFLIVTVADLLIAALLGFLGYREITRVRGLQRTQASVASAQDAIRGALSSPRTG